MAGVTLDDIDCYFAWQAWHLWHWVGSGGALGQPWRRDAAAFCVAGVALRDICLHFVWQAWHFVTSTFDPPSLCVAGAALDDMDCYFAWQAWRLWHWVGTGLALAARLVSHGAVTPRPFSWQAWHFSRHLPSLCVAGVALRDICLHFVWQAWHLTTSIVTLRGRRGTYGTGLALAARLVSHGAVTPRRFAWQAWHFVTSAFTLCGRRGTL